jgi:hypothetical protein
MPHENLSRRSILADGMTEDEIVGFNCLEPQYVDGVAGMVNLGANFAVLYFRWQMTTGGIYERAPALRVVGPVGSIACRTCADTVRGLAKPPAGAGVNAGMH